MIEANNTHAQRNVILSRGLAPLAAAVAFGLSAGASAATISVNSAAATASVSNCTIVDAVASINSGSQMAGCANTGDHFGTNDTIDLSGFVSQTTILFSTPAANPDSALAITNPVLITSGLDGSGRPLVAIKRSTVSGTPNFRLIETNSNLSVLGLALVNGYSNAYGGAIEATYNVVTGNATVTLSNTVLSGNSAQGGGGIHTQGGAVTLASSTVSGNHALGGFLGGGGVFVYGPGGNVTAANSTISGNSANYDGGGIYAYHVGINNTTISGNSSASNGGGIFAQDLSLTSSTIAGNSVAAGKFGGGVAIGSVKTSPTLTATAALVYGNSPGNDIDAAKAQTLTGSNNLIGTHGAAVSVPGDTKTCNPVLGPLFDNGGPTKTRALFTGSCAIDAGAPTPADNDQRGPGFLRKVGAGADIGAFEKQGPSDPPDVIFINGFDP